MYIWSNQITGLEGHNVIIDRAHGLPNAICATLNRYSGDQLPVVHDGGYVALVNGL